ncbi:der, partial [Symbiodinium necroappetens]
VLVDNSATSCVRYATNKTAANYTGGPCFNASVDVRLPSCTDVRSRILGSIREDRFLDVRVSGTPTRECLFLWSQV